MLESTRRVDTVVLDKTGTVTTGRMTVLDVVPAAGEDAAEVLRLAAAVEHASEHPIARAVADCRRRSGVAARRSRASTTCPASARRASCVTSTGPPRRCWSAARSCSPTGATPLPDELTDRRR